MWFFEFMDQSQALESSYSKLVELALVVRVTNASIVPAAEIAKDERNEHLRSNDVDTVSFLGGGFEGPPVGVLKQH
jgi:hypothetical protein